MNADTCPQCGADLVNSSGVVCPQCDAVLAASTTGPDNPNAIGTSRSWMKYLVFLVIPISWIFIMSEGARPGEAAVTALILLVFLVVGFAIASRNTRNWFTHIIASLFFACGLIAVCVGIFFVGCTLFFRFQ